MIGAVYLCLVALANAVAVSPLPLELPREDFHGRAFVLVADYVSSRQAVMDVNKAQCQRTQLIPAAFNV